MNRSHRAPLFGALFLGMVLGAHAAAEDSVVPVSIEEAELRLGDPEIEDEAGNLVAEFVVEPGALEPSELFFRISRDEDETVASGVLLDPEDSGLVRTVATWALDASECGETVIVELVVHALGGEGDPGRSARRFLEVDVPEEFCEDSEL